MNITSIAVSQGGQDGAIYGGYLFRFDHAGKCCVYDMEKALASGDEQAEKIAEFTLDRADEIAPHSNAVVFGNEFYAEDDEFPLLYTNIYNNYAKAADPLVGVCCVYRLTGNGTEFSTKLVQLIEIGFTDEKGLWRSEGDVKDVRPYGNFVIDIQNGIYYSFVMRDGDKTTRYFSFDLPKLCEGEIDNKYGVKKVTLKADEIKEYFDTPYHNFIQGACFYDGKIYSVEGFNEDVHPAIRIIDPKLKKQTYFFDFCDAGYSKEAEFIDFYNGACIYGDAHGNYYELKFD